MIVDERLYTLHPGKAAEYLELYENEGMAVQIEILGNMIGYFFTEVGPLNQIVHLWGYDNFEERSRRRAALMQNDIWKSYVVKMRPLVLKQENKILIPAPFSPIGK